MTTRSALFMALCAAFTIHAPAQTRNASPPKPVKVWSGYDIRDFDDTRVDKVIRTAEVRPRLAPSAVTTSTIGTSSAARVVFNLINQKRMASGLRPLMWSETAARMAETHSNEMAGNRYLSHNGIDGRNVSSRADGLGLGRWRAVGENVAVNRSTDPPRRAVEQWLTSNGHKNNIFDSSWQESAVGVAIGRDGAYYFTQVFIKR